MIKGEDKGVKFPCNPSKFNMVKSIKISDKAHKILRIKSAKDEISIIEIIDNLLGVKKQ